MSRTQTFRTLLALTSLTGCGEGEAGAPDAGGQEAGTERCLPGASVACTCSDGSSGAQICQSDAMGYDRCLCDGDGGPGATDGGEGGPNTADATTGDAGCEDGDEAACDCSHLGVSGVVRVCEDGAFGECDCEAAPGAPTLSRPSGGYGAGETFDCIDVTGEPFTEVRYKIGHSLRPTPPGVDATAGSRICGIDENGETWIVARLVDDNGVLGPVVEGHYVQRSELPVIDSVAHDLEGIGYPGMTFSLTVEADPGLDIRVDIGTRDVAVEDPEGDGTYTAEVEVAVGDLAESLTVTAEGTDVAGQQVQASAPQALHLDGVGTEVSGAQAGDLTWTPEDSPYVIQADAAINAAGSLTIEPGTVVVFLGGNMLRVDGALSAVGDACDVIRFVGTGTLWFNGPSGMLTYDPADGAYVEGPRLEHLWGPDLTLVAERLYLRRSTLHTFASPQSAWSSAYGYFCTLIHSYLGQSQIERVACVNSNGETWRPSSFLRVDDSRLEDLEAAFAHLSLSYVSTINDAGWGVRHCHFEELQYCDDGNGTFEQNTLDQLVLRGDPVTNNVLGVEGSDALRVTFDANPPDPGTQIDLSGNYWPGINATLQSAAPGYDAPEIDDYWNDISLPEVLFDPPLASAPADAAPRGSVGGEPECP